MIMTLYNFGFDDAEAEKLAKSTGTDLFEIVPKVPQTWIDKIQKAAPVLK